jgi:predicted ribosome quality control (RQC) complex YloA/Tae2 family protein
MQKFSEFIKEHKTLLENNAKASKVEEFTTLYEAKLKELGAKSLMDLDEEQMEKFNTYVKSLKEEISKGDIKKMVKDETKDLEKKVKKAEDTAKAAEDTAEGAEKDADKAKKKAGQDEVTDEKSFREYAEGVLKKAHGDDYDEKIGNKVIDGIIGKVKDDNWGEAIGRLTSGLGG